MKVMDELNKHTYAIGPAYHEDFTSMIYTNAGYYFSKHKPVELLDRFCHKFGNSYLGSITSVRKQLGYNKKTPIIISPEERLYCFPTISPDKYDCLWLFPKYILQQESDKSLVMFKNGHSLPLNCSYKTYKDQIQKSSHCLLMFTQRKSFQITIKNDEEEE
ncbi:hypothetical protein Q75_05085 [Bacillus coahuilensis p1.1.43]|uniref:Competence protein n=1 Tax=Bacillus coahuilensis p1.1.43 TaxID=1150625 RepID=A0A147KA91_9BACI|nr:competence protein ComK [Bacillus coahuilensis]KUP07603.1 hypothetical protein Q75_05085 [Bacillus coahuilensis p1.1.43]